MILLTKSFWVFKLLSSLKWSGSTSWGYWFGFAPILIDKFWNRIEKLEA